ncbi:MAG: IS66 family transposase [Deltaproteobacteria bacterium]|nr:IS66 family transposase [Deltaproteobacteria bacterium]
MGINLCRECLKKQQRIDTLLEENQRLKQKLKYQERREKEGFFGSATSSAKVPVKANTPKLETGKRRGAQRGHKGAGRKAFPEGEADRVVTVGNSLGSQCPACGRLLEEKGVEERLVIESQPLKAQRVIYRLPKKYCPHCQKVFQTRTPEVLPKSLYGNQLITTAAVMHYLHGIPMGRVCEQTEMGPGSLVEIFHRLARLFEEVPGRLIQQYRQSPVKHADETTWRTEGQNGYAWLFATETLSIFQFRKSRSASVPQAVFGGKTLPGVLVVDRYAGYNKAPCAIQYCYAHLLREVENLGKEFPDSREVQGFVATFIPLLTLAMGLRNQRLSPAQFQRKATQVQSQIWAAVESPAQHLGIRRIQDIFRENDSRLYHWAKDRNVPAENNLAERDLRPTVIARKVSFGSQSDAGAHTRGILMTVLGTLKKRGVDVATHLKLALDALAKDIHQDPFPLLFPRDPPNPKPSSLP